jgi:DNA gyrase subunit A
MLNLKDMIRHFVEFRHEVVIRRTQYDLREAEKRAHILEGLIIAINNVDEVIALIKASKDVDAAKVALIERFELSEIQAKAILEMRLQRLTGLEIDKLKQEYEEVMQLITRLKEILADENIRMNIIKDELFEIKEKYGDARRSVIEMHGEDISMEDIISDDEMVVTISHLGYIKRTPLEEFRVQGRGGRGSVGGKTREEDFIEHMFVASAHNYLLLFTNSGKCFWLRVYEIPEATKTSKGRAIQNLLSIPQEDKIKAFIKVTNLKDEEFLDNNFIVMASKMGTLKKTSLRDYSRPRANGINAITIKENDELLAAQLTDGNSEIILASSSGYAVRFDESQIRPMGRTASGVRGMKLRNENDEVVGMICATKGDENPRDILVVSAKGYGKRSELEEYRITNRGGKGVKTISITDKTGKLIDIKGVTDNDELMIINRSGITIRTSLEEVRVMGRATQGVRLIKLNGDDEIASVARVEKEDDVNDGEDNGTIVETQE